MLSSHSDSAPMWSLDLGEGLGPQGRVLKECALSWSRTPHEQTLSCQCPLSPVGQQGGNQLELDEPG